MMKIFSFIFFLLPFLAISQTQRIAATDHVQQQGLQFVNVTDNGQASQAAGYWNKGDFLVFQLDVPRAGHYVFTFRTGTNIEGARYELRDEKEKVLATILPLNTGSHGNFVSISADVKLKAGKQLVRYISINDNSGADLNWLEYSFKRAEGAPVITMDSVLTIQGVAPGRTTNVNLKAIAKDEDGKIVSYKWERVSGKGGHLVKENSAEATINALPFGEHVYRLTVTDNDKNTASHNLRIAVIKCAGGRKIVLTPPGGNGTGLYIEAAGYSTRKHKYPTYNYPKPQILPGDTIALSSKFEWEFFEMFGIDGTPGCPIVITSDEGTVKIQRRIILTDCNYIKITGRDANDNNMAIDEMGTHTYRIRIGESKIRDIAIGIQGRSSNIEVDKIRAENIWYGVQAKTDPPQDPHCDSMYNYPNWIMDSIHIHHSFFKNTLQDVLYLGNTDPFGERSYKCNGRTVNFIPMRIANFNIHHNRIWIANRTGIMLSGAETGHNHINNNHISDMGYEFNQHQGTGISLGGMTRNTHVYNNRIRNTFLYGIFDLAAGMNFIYNNYIDSSGYLNMRMYADQPNLKPDSVARALGLANVGHFLKNTHQGGITNIQSTTKGAKAKIKKTIVIRNNILGMNSSANSPHGNISFAQWGPAEDWSTRNIICGNTRLDKRTPASVHQFKFNDKNPKWPVYQEDCKTPISQFGGQTEESPPPKKPGNARSYIIVGGSVLFISALAYIMVQKKLLSGNSL
jgi:hypothetical protein